MLTLDHVNIRTADVERLVAFYRRALGLMPGARPAFPFPGAWLYSGAQAVVHLVGVECAPTAPRDGGTLRLEHFAFRAQNLEAFLAHLEAEGIDYQLSRPPGGSAQVNLWDPDGNHLHIDFAPPADGT